MPRPAAASMTARPSAPLCEENPIEPHGGALAAKVAFSRGSATAIPRQFGPIMRAPCRRTKTSSCSCRSMPSIRPRRSPPRSRRAATNALPECPLCASSTRPPGTQMTARSIRIGNFLDRGVAAHAGDRLAADVHREGGADEIAGEHVTEELAADGTATLEAPMTATAAGTQKTVAATRPLPSDRHRRRVRGTSPVGEIGNVTSVSPRHDLPQHLEADVLEHRQHIALFSGSTSAMKRSTPCVLAIADSCSSNRVPIPRPRYVSATVNATSAVVGSRRRE